MTPTRFPSTAEGPGRQFLPAVATAPPSAIRPRFRGRLFGAALLLALAGGVAAGDPDEVLIELPRRPTPDAVEPDAAISTARQLIDQHRRTADNRTLGRAEALLTPLLGQIPEARLLYAVILQRRHRFEAALQQLASPELDRLADPNRDLQRAALLRVLGRLDAAESACTPLQHASAWLAALCRLPIQSLRGDPRPAQEALLRLPVPPEPQWLAWRASELAEIAERLGEVEAAGRHWQQAVALSPDDPFARTQWAEHHLQRGDYRAVLDGIDADTPHGSLQLVRLLARRALNDDGWRRDAEALAESYQRAIDIHGEAHQREAARIALDLLDQPQRALTLARQNWDLQKEPADALLLARAAHAAGRPEALALLHAFVARWHYHDHRLTPLLASGP